MNKNNSAFTFVEVIVSFLLSAIVVFFAYTMMVSSYNLYRKFLSASNSANDFRFFSEMLKTSITYAEWADIQPAAMTFGRYDMNRKQFIKEEYSFSNKSLTFTATNLITSLYTVYPNLIPDSSVTDTLVMKLYYTNSAYATKTEVTARPITVLTNIKKFYYSEHLQDLYDVKIGVSFNKILETGKPNNMVTKPEKRCFCFSARGKIQ